MLDVTDWDDTHWAEIDAVNITGMLPENAAVMTTRAEADAKVAIPDYLQRQVRASQPTQSARCDAVLTPRSPTPRVLAAG